jgi:CBS domain-containing protein
MRACDVMSGPVVTVGPDTTAEAAWVLLRAHGLTAVPVVDDADRLVGMVSEADLDGDGHGPAHGLDPPTVADVMCGPTVAMPADTNVIDLTTQMLSRRACTIPIVDGARLVGVVTRRDLLRRIARDDDVIAADVRDRLAAYGGPDRWTVSVCDGVVTITGVAHDETDRHVATVLAEAVPGVVRVRSPRRRSSEPG